MHDTWRICVCLLLGIMAGSGCTSSPTPMLIPTATVIRVPGIDPGSWRAGGVFVAGVGKVDITPPPGLPLFGYSRARTGDAAGVHTRLYARALYLEDARGEHVVLVQCDLGAISALLHLQVARAIVQETGVSAGPFSFRKELADQAENELKGFVPRGGSLSRHAPMTQNPFMKADPHDTTASSAHRSFL
jgi:Neutral/alkaline non-lysosomal ceramidase, N-terminal